MLIKSKLIPSLFSIPLENFKEELLKILKTSSKFDHTVSTVDKNEMISNLELKSSPSPQKRTTGVNSSKKRTTRVNSPKEKTTSVDDSNKIGFGTS